jgi:hypothetical protein
MGYFVLHVLANFLRREIVVPDLSDNCDFVEEPAALRKQREEQRKVTETARRINQTLRAAR